MIFWWVYESGIREIAKVTMIQNIVCESLKTVIQMGWEIPGNTRRTNGGGGYQVFSNNAYASHRMRTIDTLR